MSGTSFKTSSPLLKFPSGVDMNPPKTPHPPGTVVDKLGRRKRPDLFETRIKPELKKLKELAEIGYTDKQVADYFALDPATLVQLKKRHPQISQILIEGRRKAKQGINNALYKRAHGWTEQVEELVAVRDGDGNTIRHEVKRVNKYFPPDMGAMRMWTAHRDEAHFSEHGLSREERIEVIKKVNALRDQHNWTAAHTARVYEEHGCPLPKSLEIELAKELKDSLPTQETPTLKIVLPDGSTLEDLATLENGNGT